MPDISIYVEDLTRLDDTAVIADEDLLILNQERRSKGLPFSVLKDKIGGGGTSEKLTGIIDTKTSKVAVNTDVTGWTVAHFIEEAFTGVVPGTVSVTSPANKTLENGDDQTNVVLTATATAGSTPVTELKLIVGGTVMETIANPVGAQSFTVPSVTSNTTFKASILDTAGTHNSNSRSYTFVYPYYWGAGAVGLDATGITALTKTIKSKDTNHTQSFTTVSNVPYYCYPTSYGDLSSVIDQNGFETKGDWGKRVVDITGLDGTVQSYNVYEFANVTSATASYTFKL